MAGLNVSPIISALQDAPETFAFESGELWHIPSRHRFRFDFERRVTIGADCDCVSLQVRTDQERPLYDAFQRWLANYWREVEIEREFTAHFAPPSRVRGWLIAFTAWMHRAALTRPRPSKESRASFFSFGAHG